MLLIQTQPGAERITAKAGAETAGKIDLIAITGTQVMMDPGDGVQVVAMRQVAGEVTQQVKRGAWISVRQGSNTVLVNDNDLGGGAGIPDKSDSELSGPENLRNPDRQCCQFGLLVDMNGVHSGAGRMESSTITPDSLYGGQGAHQGAIATGGDSVAELCFRYPAAVPFSQTMKMLEHRSGYCCPNM